MQVRIKDTEAFWAYGIPMIVLEALLGLELTVEEGSGARFCRTSTGYEGHVVRTSEILGALRRHNRAAYEIASELRQFGAYALVLDPRSCQTFRGER